MKENVMNNTSATNFGPISMSAARAIVPKP